MRSTILVILILFSSSLMGMTDPCEKGSPFEELSVFNGKRTIGDCFVEVHICEKREISGSLPYYLSAPLEDKSQYWVGDVYVKKAYGKSLYVPLYAVESNFPNTTISLVNLSDMIRYNYKDKNFDPVSGRKENYELKFYKRRKKIEVSMSNSREARRNPIRTLFVPDIKIKCAN